MFLYNPEAPLLFTRPYFWLFLLAVYSGFILLYKKRKLKITFLFLCSLFFYYKSGGYFFSLLLFSTFTDYYFGIQIARNQNSLPRKLFLTLSVVINLGVLFYFKYAYFFADLISNLKGSEVQITDYIAQLTNTLVGTHFDIENIILPVGVSFYTFQTISYTVDVFRRKVEPVKSIIDFGFYVSFFPQLVAGPIVRAAEFIPQLYKDFHLTREEFSIALFLILNGLIKKILISDFISVNFVDRVFESPQMYSGFENLMALYGYSIQIYCDFSGYTDIAIGLGLLFGFRLPLNFNSPYKAISITDFWRRWHISLSSWLRDYLYIPLGGNRISLIRTYANLIVTMLLGGLWHGAALRFLIWGGLHGIALAVDKFLTSTFHFRFKAYSWISAFVTFHFVTFTWLFFRAPDVDHIKTMVYQISSNFSIALIPEYITNYAASIGLIFIGFLIHWLPAEFKSYYKTAFCKTPLWAKAIVTILIIIGLFNIQSADLQAFIYFQF